MSGYVTDEEEFMTQEEMKESDEVITAAGDCYEEEKVFVGSDVSALYPSCTAKMAGEAVRKAILKTQLDFEGVDYKELSKYVAINCSRLEVCEVGLRRVVPVQAEGGQAGHDGRGRDGATQGEERWAVAVAP